MVNLSKSSLGWLFEMTQNSSQVKFLGPYSSMVCTHLGIQVALWPPAKGLRPVCQFTRKVIAFNGIIYPCNWSKQILDTHKAYYTRTQYTRQSLNATTMYSTPGGIIWIKK